MFHAMDKMRTIIEKSGYNLSGITDALGIKKRFNQADLVFIEKILNSDVPDFDSPHYSTSHFNCIEESITNGNRKPEIL